jgi:hypothetical protein
MEEAEAVMSAFLTNVENRRSALGPADSNGSCSKAVRATSSTLPRASSSKLVSSIEVAHTALLLFYYRSKA